MTPAATTHCQVRAQDEVAGLGSGRCGGERDRQAAASRARSARRPRRGLRPCRLERLQRRGRLLVVWCLLRHLTLSPLHRQASGSA